MRANVIHRQALTLVLAIAGTAIASTKPASAQILSDSPFKGALTTLGIVTPERDPIVYHERAPLVVPKSLDLPPPAQHIAERNAEWPTDPDVAAKLKEKAESAQPVVRRQGGDNGGGGAGLGMAGARGEIVEPARAACGASRDLL